MEQFLIDNAERYKKLVAAFKPTAQAPKAGSFEAATPEIVVSARVRPMLEDETAQGFPAGVHLRAGNTNIVDLHELQQPVRGLPRIRVGGSNAPSLWTHLTLDSPQISRSTGCSGPTPRQPISTTRW
jgi:kinesin family protein 2/24